MDENTGDNCSQYLTLPFIPAWESMPPPTLQSYPSRIYRNHHRSSLCNRRTRSIIRISDHRPPNLSLDYCLRFPYY
jgi:hypothetical protein